MLTAAGIDAPEDGQDAPEGVQDAPVAVGAQATEERGEPGRPAEPEDSPQAEPDTALAELDTPQAEPDTPSQPDALQFPWDYGTPPLLTSLITGQRSVIAVCVAEAADETSVRQRLLRFFCAAYSCSPAALELQLPNLAPSDSEVRQMSADECRAPACRERGVSGC